MTETCLIARVEWVGGGWEATDQELRKELEQTAFKAVAARLIGDDKRCSTLARREKDSMRQFMRRCKVSGVHSMEWRRDVRLAVCGLSLATLQACGRL
jgi:hypothetical protein